MKNGTQEAYNAGKQAFQDGVDLVQAPSYYTQTEQELYILGYEEESMLAEELDLDEDELGDTGGFDNYGHMFDEYEDDD